MRNYSRLILQIILLTLAPLLTGCHQNNMLSPHKWVKIDRAFDSITLVVEHQLNNYNGYDSMRRNIELLNIFSKADTSDYNVKQARYHYFRSRLFQKEHNKDSCLYEIKKALELNDSNKYMYDRMRMLSILYTNTDSIDGAAMYRHFDECISYSKKIGDKTFEAHSKINLANLLSHVGEHKRSLDLLIEADSLLNMEGFYMQSFKNKINSAQEVKELGRQEESDSILRSMIGHPFLKGDTYTSNLLPRNLYASTDSIKYLKMAYEEIKDIPQFSGLKSVYLAQMAYHYRTIPDSVIYYSGLAIKDLNSVELYGQKTLVVFVKALACKYENKLDSALRYRIEYEKYADSFRQQKNQEEILRLSALKELGNAQAKYSAELYKRNLIGAGIILLIVITGGCVIFMVHRRHVLQKITAMETEVALERSKRKMAVSALAIEEKDNMLGVLRDELSMLRKEGKIGEGNARHLESTIKAHLSEHESEETFRDMFDVVNPIFRTRLAELCPGLAESYVKIACYIMMDLDNKKIARIMMIKPESVRQARWRLSRKLNLPEGTTLEDFLRRLNNP